jgi:hypothetical protein
MCTANLPRTRKAETIHYLAMASVLYAQTVLRLDRGAQSGVSACTWTPSANHGSGIDLEQARGEPEDHVPCN